MATWLTHIRLQYGGTLGGGAEEIWSNTVNFKINADRGGNVGSVLPTGSQLEDALDDLVVPLKAWYARAATGISASAQLTYAKLNSIKTDGHQADQNTHLREFAGVAGGVAGINPPWFVSLANTLRTDYKRGRAHSGRVFPPVIAIPAGNGSPYISDAAATAAAASFATALNEIALAIGGNGPLPSPGGCFPVVISPVTATGPDPGGALALPVTRVVCDRVHDVQHRRTNRVPRSEGAAAPITS